MAGALLMLGASLAATPAAAETPQQAPAAAPAQQTPPASGQPAPGDEVGSTDVIIVTARREERLIDIPAAGSAVGAERIAELGGLQDQRTLTALLPGVSLVDNDSGNSEFAIRGAGQAGRSINADAAIALLRNGAQVTGGNIGGRGFARMDFFDIERIEVLRGAQGSLYGANAVGGVVSIVSQAPKDRFEALVDLKHNLTTVGLDGSAIVNLPVTDTLAVRLGVEAVEEWEGQVYNTFRDDYADSTAYRGVRASVGYTPSDALRIVVSLDGSRIDEGTGAQVDVQRRLYPAIVETFDYRSQVEGDANSKYRQNIFNGAVLVEADLGFADLTSTTNYRWRDSFAISDDDGRFPGAPPLASTGQRNIAGGVNCRSNTCITAFVDQATVFFQEAVLAGEADRLDWQVGADYRALTDTYSINNFGRRTPANAPIAPQFQTLLSDNTTLGAFATARYALTDTVDFEASGRWTQDEKEFEGGLSTGAPQIGSIPLSRRTYVNWTYGGSLSWRPTPRSNLYARIATGFRAGGFNRDTGTSSTLPGAPVTPIAYDEENTTAYEVGFKHDVSPRLRVSSAVFYSDYADVLITDQGTRSVAQGGGAYNYLDNLGDAKAFGLEVEASGVWRDFGVPGGRLAYTVATTWFDSALDSVVRTVDGRELNGSPEFMATVNGSYFWPLAGELSGFIAPSFQYEHGGFFNIANTVERDTNRNLRLRLGVRSRNGWEIAAAGTNLLNQTYEFLYGAGFLAETPAPEYTIEFRYRFD
jgi:iron complex outermembrane receptor protein